MASRDSSIAPSSDSSAWRLWGGTRPPPPCCRRRASSIACTIATHPRPPGLWGASGRTLWISGGQRRGCPQRLLEHMFESVLRRGDSLDGDAELHVGVQLDRDLVHTDRLDGLVEVQPP